MRQRATYCHLAAVTSLVLAVIASPAAADDAIDYGASVTYQCRGSRDTRAAGRDSGELTLTNRKLVIRPSKDDDDEISLAVYRSAKPWCLDASSPSRCMAKRRKVDVFKVIAGADGVDASFLRRDAFDDSIAVFDGTLKIGPEGEVAKLTGTLTLVDKDSDCIAQLRIKAKAPTGPQPIQPVNPAPGPQLPSQPNR